jgi:cytochrome c5
VTTARRCAPLAFAAALAAAVAACAGQLPAPTQANAARAAERYPGATLADLQRGRGLYVDHCSGCHSLYAPSEHTAHDWPKLLGEMAKRAKLSDPDTTLVLEYLVGSTDRR